MADRQSPDENPTDRSGAAPHGPDPREPPRPDPRTGEVPAGPGDAGREDRPEVNRGSPGGRQMSNRRLGIGLGMAAVLAAVAMLFALLA